jgi:hypothetical protein
LHLQGVCLINVLQAHEESAKGLVDSNGKGWWDIMAKVDAVAHNLITVGNEGCGLLKDQKRLHKGSMSLLGLYRSVCWGMLLKFNRKSSESAN